MMDLRAEERVAMPTCFACRWAKRDIIIWPLEPKRQPEAVGEDRTKPNSPMLYTSGTWFCFFDVKETIFVATGSSQRLRSRKGIEEFCPEHWKRLWADWEYVIWQEVAYDYIWHQWIERMER